MKIKPILFGSTGMIGQGVLLECLESPDVESILVVNRRQGGLQHGKLKEVIHADFQDFSALSSMFAGYDTCFFCLGVSAVGLSEEEYHKITYDIVTKAAGTMLKANPGSTFCYISGAGADSSEKGKMMWARVKGKTENALLSMPFRASYMFRPGYIQPMKGIRSRTRLYNMVYFVFKPLYFLLKAFKSLVTNTGTLGRAMIRAGAYGYTRRILESTDINILGKES